MKKQYSHAVNIYVGDTQNAHSQYIQHRMSIDCFGPPFKFGDFTDLDLKQNAFLRQWISPHRHRKYIHFFTINAHLEYYFFLYKVIIILIIILTGGRKNGGRLLVLSNKIVALPTKHILQSHYCRDSYIFNLGDIPNRVAFLEQLDNAGVLLLLLLF